MTIGGPDPLLMPRPDRPDRNGHFQATIIGHGLYRTDHFVLRLSPVVHQLLQSAPRGVTTNAEIGFERAKAMSTYLHETVHWWQHIGSTYGLLLSLNYPVQAHATHAHLMRLVQEDGFKKSVRLQADKLSDRGVRGSVTPAATANTVINNHFDLLAYRAFTLGPTAVRDVIEHNLFENVGHAFHMTYANTISVLAATVDRNFESFTHPKNWTDEFRALADGNVKGYYYGSPIELWEVGSYEIFEGQAHFAQIQYLSNACGHRLSWSDYRSAGMLHGVYVLAFEAFLRGTGNHWPSTVADPLVGMFLLVCDLAINPGNGFPFPIAPHFGTFISDVNPGARFATYCHLLRSTHKDLVGSIRNYDRSEYEYVTSRLTNSAYDHSPLAMAREFAAWFAPKGAMGNLRSEYDSYVFINVNYVIRHLFAHFLAFQEDKHSRPEFFCWPGAWMAGERLNSDAMPLFAKHEALFVDKEDDDSVFPRLQAGREDKLVSQAFDNFYYNVTLFDLVNQWIATSGPFHHHMHWLTSYATVEEVTRYQRRAFSNTFGLELNSVEILASAGP